VVSVAHGTAQLTAREVGPMGSIVLIVVVAVAALVIFSDLFVTERRRRRTLRSYFVPQEDEHFGARPPAHATRHP